MKRLLQPILLIILLMGGMFCMNSCEKDQGDYNLTVVVTVNDTTRVANAFVRVYAPVSNTTIDYYDNVDENGEKNYSFDNEVVVEVIATKSSFRACNFAEVERGDNTVYVNLKPFGSNDNGCLSSN